MIVGNGVSVHLCSRILKNTASISTNKNVWSQSPSKMLISYCKCNYHYDEQQWVAFSIRFLAEKDKTLFIFCYCFLCNRLITFKTKYPSQAAKFKGILCNPYQRTDQIGRWGIHSNHDSLFLGRNIVQSLSRRLGSVPEKVARAVAFPFDILSLNGWWEEISSPSDPGGMAGYVVTGRLRRHVLSDFSWGVFWWLFFVSFSL